MMRERLNPSQLLGQTNGVEVVVGDGFSAGHSTEALALFRVIEQLADRLYKAVSREEIDQKAILTVPDHFAQGRGALLHKSIDGIHCMNPA